MTSKFNNKEMQTHMKASLSSMLQKQYTDFNSHSTAYLDSAKTLDDLIASVIADETESMKTASVLFGDDTKRQVQYDIEKLQAQEANATALLDKYSKKVGEWQTRIQTLCNKNAALASETLTGEPEYRS